MAGKIVSCTCGSRNITMEHVDSEPPGDRLKCDRCGAQPPLMPSMDRAVWLWRDMHAHAKRSIEEAKS